MGVQLQVSHLNFCNSIPVIGYFRDLHVNYARFNGFFSQCFAQFSTFKKSATDVFAQKNFPKDIFNSKICYRYDLKLVIGPRVVQFREYSCSQFQNGFVLRARPILKLLERITPWIVLHWTQLLLQSKSFIEKELWILVFKYHDKNNGFKVSFKPVTID